MRSTNAITALAFAKNSIDLANQLIKGNKPYNEERAAIIALTHEALTHTVDALNFLKGTNL
jgi:hypothetical protein